MLQLYHCTVTNISGVIQQTKSVTESNNIYFIEFIMNAWIALLLVWHIKKEAKYTWQWPRVYGVQKHNYFMNMSWPLQFQLLIWLATPQHFKCLLKIPITLWSRERNSQMESPKENVELPAFSQLKPSIWFHFIY